MKVRHEVDESFLLKKAVVAVAVTAVVAAGGAALGSTTHDSSLKMRHDCCVWRVAPGTK